MSSLTKQLLKISKFILVFVLIFSWLFSGWPQQVWLDQMIPDQTVNKTSDNVSDQTGVPGDLLLLGNNNFRIDEAPEFRLKMPVELAVKMTVVRNVANLLGLLGVSTARAEKFSAPSVKGELFSLADRKTVDVKLITKTSNGELKVIVPKLENQFKPGKYTLKVEMADGEKVLTGTRDFTLGVLTINTNKSIFIPGEKVYLQMTSLNEYGRASCKSKLELKIKNLGSGVENILSTENGTIKTSDTCGPNNVTDSPDYFSYYEVTQPGVYQLQLTNLDTAYETTDSFEVRDNVPFEIERVGATRINPFLASYKMTLRVKANQDFDGTVTEKLPSGFEVVDAGGAKVENSVSEKELIWNVHLKKGEQTTLQYEYQAPKISPELFLLGAAELKQDGKVIFKEARQWHIGSDVTYDCAISLSAAANWSMNWGASCNNSYPGATGTGDTASISFTGTTAAIFTLNVSPANALGAITFNRPSGTKGLTLAIGANTLSAASIALGGTTGTSNLTVISISTGLLDVAGNITSAGVASKITFTSTGKINVGGFFMSGALGTFTASTGTINFDGSTSQIPSGWVYTYNIFSVNNTAGVTLGAACTIKTLIIGNVTAGSVFNDGGFVITPGSSSVLNLTNGTYNLGSATVGNAWPAWATRNISAGTTVGYVSGVAQAVSITPSYSNLTFSGAGAKTPATGTLTVGGDWSVTGGTTTLSTYNNPVTVTGDITGTGAITSGSGTITIGGNWTNNGTFTKGTGKVTYNTAGGGQTVGGLSYNNLTLSNNSGTADTAGGDITVGATFTTTAGGTLDMGTNALSVVTVSHSGILNTQNTSAAPITTGKIWGGTVNYNALTGGQTVVGLSYNNLTLSNTSGTETAGGTIIVNGALITGSSIFDMATYQLAGSLTTINNNGTITTANTTNSAIPSGETWNGIVEYDAASGIQYVASGNYTNLTATTASARTLKFSTSAITNVSGTWTITGSSGQLITLTSLVTPNQWPINPTAASVSYADISYSNNIGASFCAAYSTSASDNNTLWQIGSGSSCNTAPSFSGDPTDSPDPVVTGQDVTFSGTANDSESDNWYLAVCKSDSITAGSPPTCAPNQTLCVSSSAVTTGSQNTCTWTSTGSTPQDWYAFACDNDATPFCSTANVVNSPVTVNVSQYTLLYNSGVGGSLTGSTIQYIDYGADGTAVTAVPDANYHFVNWSDSSTQNPRTDLNVTADNSYTANFAIDTHVVTYTAGANGTLSGSTTQTINYGTDGTAVTAVPNANYHFVNWSDSSTQNPRTDTNITADASFTANFAIDAHTLSYTAGANGTLSGSTTQTINYGANGTAVTAVPDANYHFVNWSDLSVQNPRTDTNITADVSFTANFAIDTHTLTYTAGANGTLSGSTTQTINYGANGTAVTAVPNSNYHFVNWSADSSTQNPRTDLNVTNNNSYTANFALNTNIITYTAGANGMLTGSTTQTINYGANGSAVTAVPNSNYHFVNWSDSSTQNPRTDLNVTTGHSYTANFAIDQHTLLYNSGVGGSLTGTTIQYVNYGANGTAVTAVPNANYHFVNWSDSSTQNPRTDTNVTAANSYTANFALDTHVITYTAGANGTLTGSTTQIIAYGGNGTAVTAVPNANYHFVNWSADSSTQNPRTDLNVTATNSYTANFAINVTNYTLTYTAGANGTLTGSTTQTIVSGANGSAVTAVPNANYHFVNWSDSSTQNPRTDTNVLATNSYTANFAINTNIITYTAGANGTLTGSTTQTIAYGGNGTAVTAVANLHYHFVNWSADSSVQNPRTDTNVTAGHSYTANFAIDQYTILYGSGVGGSLTGSTIQYINYGANGTAVTAVPNANYHFVNWSDSSTQNPRTDLNVVANNSVTANFALDTHVITYTAGANGTLSGSTTQTIVYGANGTAVTAVPNANYHFVNWSDSSTQNPRTDTNVVATNSFTANFAINTNIITYTAGANGTLTGSTTQTIAYGGNGTAVTAVPNANYHFVNWSADSSTQNPRTDLNVTATNSYTANFAINITNYTLTYTAGANGTLTGSTTQTIVSGANGSAVTAVPNANYHFVNWTDSSTQNPRTDTNVLATNSFTANFAIDQFTLLYSASVGGSLTGTATQYINYGANASTVTAVANANYIFNKWSDNVMTAARTDTNIVANNSVMAQFVPSSYTLQYVAGANGTLTGNTTQVVAFGGTAAAVTAVPNATYHFTVWSDGSSQNPRTDTNVALNNTFTANFGAAASTKVQISTTSSKISINSSGRGLVAFIPLKLKYAKSTSVAGSEIFTDKTPYANDGQNYSAVAGASYSTFDGINDYIKIPISASLQTQTNLTLSAWVKPNASYTGDAIIIGQNAYYLAIGSDWSARAYWLGKSSAGPYSSGAGTISAGTWNLITAVWDASNVRIYVNDVLKNTTPSTGTGNLATTQVWIGAENNGATRAFKGDITNVRIYSSALSAGEIASLYNQGLDDSSFMLRGQ